LQDVVTLGTGDDNGGFWLRTAVDVLKNNAIATDDGAEILP